jgi:hypothetical protein
VISAHKRASDVTKTSAARETARPKGLVVNIRSLDFWYVMPCGHTKIVLCPEMVVAGSFETLVPAQQSAQYHDLEDHHLENCSSGARELRHISACCLK